MNRFLAGVVTLDSEVASAVTPGDTSTSIRLNELVAAVGDGTSEALSNGIHLEETVAWIAYIV